MAAAVGVSPRRIRVTGFLPGSVRVQLEIGQALPTGDDPWTADAVLEELRRQVQDPSSKLRCGEIGRLCQNAVVTNIMNDAEIPKESVKNEELTSSYFAPSGDFASVPKPLEVDPSRSGIQRFGPDAADTKEKEGSGKQKAPLIKSAWEDDTYDSIPTVPPQPGQPQVPHAGKKPIFRASRDGDEKKAEWVQPYQEPPMYYFYDSSAVATRPAHQKFTPYARFNLTRHPVGITGPGKGDNGHYKTWGSLTLATASSWIENEVVLSQTLLEAQRRAVEEAEEDQQDLDSTAVQSVPGTARVTARSTASEGPEDDAATVPIFPTQPEEDKEEKADVNPQDAGDGVSDVENELGQDAAAAKETEVEASPTIDTTPKAEEAEPKEKKKKKPTKRRKSVDVSEIDGQEGGATGSVGTAVADAIDTAAVTPSGKGRKSVKSPAPKKLSVSPSASPRNDKAEGKASGLKQEVDAEDAAKDDEEGGTKSQKLKKASRRKSRAGARGIGSADDRSLSVGASSGLAEDEVADADGVLDGVGTQSTSLKKQRSRSSSKEPQEQGQSAKSRRSGSDKEETGRRKSVVERKSSRVQATPIQEESRTTDERASLGDSLGISLSNMEDELSDSAEAGATSSSPIRKHSRKSLPRTIVTPPKALKSDESLQKDREEPSEEEDQAAQDMSPSVRSNARQSMAESRRSVRSSVSQNSGSPSIMKRSSEALDTVPGSPGSAARRSRAESADKNVAWADEKRKTDKRASSEGAIKRKTRKTEVDAVSLQAAGAGRTSCWVGMTGGIPGTGLRRKAPHIQYWNNVDNEADGTVASSSAGHLDDYTSPAYIRATYRHTTVKLGPPYNIGLAAPDGSPGLGEGKRQSVWIQGANWAEEQQDKQDWANSYASIEKRPTVRLGPGRGIRGMGQTWTENLHEVAPAPEPEPTAKRHPKAKLKGKANVMSGAPGQALRKQGKPKAESKGPPGHHTHHGHHFQYATDSDTSPGPPLDRYEGGSPRSISPSDLAEGSEDYAAYAAKMMAPEAKKNGKPGKAGKAALALGGKGKNKKPEPEKKEEKKESDAKTGKDKVVVEPTSPKKLGGDHPSRPTINKKNFESSMGNKPGDDN
eukprot:gnl/MRDRNA2_/MRDRNA2_27702_c0_seq1.p1 gnl/MRDRNA2_/MRDRNA2_27702_c0~~gnl/MRDRNA2_/MRDRNA2_27702_c0_seq1.p1  ORF type:complete len:1166 (-),score=303.78 gnl/MRDRNA2_/MRDRNA2_27702_c0_seq1:467-3781(-)